MLFLCISSPALKWSFFQDILAPFAGVWYGDKTNLSGLLLFVWLKNSHLNMRNNISQYSYACLYWCYIKHSFIKMSPILIYFHLGDSILLHLIITTSHSNVEKANWIPWAKLWWTNLTKITHTPLERTLSTRKWCLYTAALRLTFTEFTHPQLFQSAFLLLDIWLILWYSAFCHS